MIIHDKDWNVFKKYLYNDNKEPLIVSQKSTKITIPCDQKQPTPEAFNSHWSFVMLIRSKKH